MFSQLNTLSNAKAADFGIQCVHRAEEPVTFYDPFQSFADLRNDILKIAIHPLTCFYLSGYFQRMFFYQLTLVALHLFSLNFLGAANHLVDALVSAGCWILYWLLGCIATAQCLISILIRTSATLIAGVRQLVNGELTFEPFKESGPTQPDIQYPAVGKLVHDSTEKKTFVEVFKSTQQHFYQLAGIKTYTIQLEDSWYNGWYQRSPNTDGECDTCFLDGLTSLADFQNEWFAMLAKPAACSFLALRCLLDIKYELYIGLIHLIALNQEEAFCHFERAMLHALGVFYYTLDGSMLAVSGVLRLLSRTLLTVCTTPHAGQNSPGDEQLTILDPNESLFQRLL